MANSTQVQMASKMPWAGGAVGLFLASLAQPPGDQRGDAHRGAHGKGDEQVLQGEGQADSGQSPFR